MLRKSKAISGNLILTRVKASLDRSLGGNMYCNNCIYYSDCRCELNENNNYNAYQFCIKITPGPVPVIGCWDRKFVYIYVEKKEIL